MDVFEAVRSLLAVREYTDRPVPEETLRRVLEAGRLTASGSNKQPWHFILVQDRETLGKIGASESYGPYVAQAAAAIVVAADRTPLAVSDASRAIQSMLLTAWADGVGGNWVGWVDFPGTQAVRGILGIPEDLDVLAILSFGYPARTIGRGVKKRKALAEIAHRERWGAAFE